MKRLQLLAIFAGLTAGTMLLTGCEGSACIECDTSPGVVVVEDCCGVLNPYTLDLFVVDGQTGYGMGGADVEVIVATTPEQAYLGQTDPDGFLRLAFEAPADTVAIAYACVPGLPCRGGDVLLRTGESYLTLVVEL